MVLLGVLGALLVAGLLVGGSLAWWLTGRTLRPRHLSRYGLDAQAALWRHPAGRGRWLPPDNPSALDTPGGRFPQQPTGPDDDAEFLSHLDRLIHGRDHSDEN